MDEIMVIQVLLKPGTQDGEVMEPLVPPESFAAELIGPYQELLLQAVKRIVARGEKPMMQILMSYVCGPTVVESPMMPVTFTETPGIYPMRKE